MLLFVSSEFTHLLLNACNLLLQVPDVGSNDRVLLILTLLPKRLLYRLDERLRIALLGVWLLQHSHQHLVPGGRSV
jgi:hypothetical protein